ncbi:MAG: hypothetical protein DI613_16905 [Kocuria rhizophila]|nr:MAG: hypothetical protein DI613_16905 [Kocuria rhizophila]
MDVRAQDGLVFPVEHRHQDLAMLLRDHQGETRPCPKCTLLLTKQKFPGGSPTLELRDQTRYR